MKNKILTIIGSVVLTATVLFGGYALANPLVFTNPYDEGCRTARATTTVTYMSAGRSTTTIGSTILGCSLIAPSNTASNGLVLNVWHTASSSPGSTLVITPYYGFSDQNGRITWYAGSTATSSAVTPDVKNISEQPGFFTLNQVATSSDPITGTASATVGTNTIIPNPQRAPYIKVHITVPIGSQNSSVWAELRNLREVTQAQ